MNKLSKNRNSKYLSYLLYIVVIIAIALVALSMRPQAPKYDFTYDSLITQLQTDKDSFDNLKVTPRQTFFVVQGSYTHLNEANKEVTYSFTVSVINTEAEYSKLTDVLDTWANSEYSIVNIYESNIFVDILIQMIPFALIFIAGYFLLSKLGSSFSKAAGDSKAFEFSQSRAKKVTNNRTTFDDVAGAIEEKQELQELVDYLKDPSKFRKMGARFPKGILLIGPPGTGKTLLAKAVAGEAKVGFYFISGSDFVEMFVGVGASRVRDMFKTAKANRPCIIFIDEIDAVGRQRGAGLGGGNDEREQTLNQLLVELDGFEENVGILVLAATNRHDVLDPALLRPGRFDRTINVSLPDRNARIAILKVHARNKRFTSDVNFENIAQRTPGFSGAQLENVINEAAILTVRAGKDIIGNDEIEEAIDRVIGGPAKKSKTMTEKERKLIAYHEAGHTIVGLKLEGSNIVQKVTIIPRGDAGGYVMMTPKDDQFLLTKTELLAKITGYLAGRTSEEVFFHDVTTGAQDDIAQATKIARTMVTELGMSDLGLIKYESNSDEVFLGRDYTSSQKLSSQTANDIDNAVRKIIDGCHQAAKDIIEKYKEIIIKIAEELLVKETLTAEEILLIATKE